ncbi:MAG: outer membrane beta-barrel protein [Candidatus Sulfotelmatobacter sp.]
MGSKKKGTKIFMRKLGFIVSVLLVFAGLANAQIPTKGNIFVGYSYENVSSSTFDFANTTRANLNGWEATVEGKVFPWVSLVGDVAGHYGTQGYQFDLGGTLQDVNVTAHEITGMFGPRVSVSVGKIRPFAEALFGVAYITTSQTSSVATNFVQPSDTGFAWALGGGVDYKLFRPIAWRFQGDYIETRFFQTTQNNIRLSTGLVFRF